MANEFNLDAFTEGLQNMVNNGTSGATLRMGTEEVSAMEFAESYSDLNVHCASANEFMKNAVQEVIQDMNESIGDKAVAAKEGIVKFFLKVINFIKGALNKAITSIKKLFGGGSYKAISKFAKEVEGVLKKAATPTANVDKKIKVQILSDELSKKLDVVNGNKAATGSLTACDSLEYDPVAIKNTADKLKQEDLFKDGVELETVFEAIDEGFDDFNDELKDIEKEEKTRAEAYIILKTRLGGVANIDVFGKNFFKDADKSIKTMEKTLKKLEKLERDIKSGSKTPAAGAPAATTTQADDIANLGFIQKAVATSIQVIVKTKVKMVEGTGKLMNVYRADMNVMRAQFTKAK